MNLSSVSLQVVGFCILKPTTSTYNLTSLQNESFPSKNMKILFLFLASSLTEVWLGMTDLGHPGDFTWLGFDPMEVRSSSPCFQFIIVLISSNVWLCRLPHSDWIHSMVSWISAKFIRRKYLRLYETGWFMGHKWMWNHPENHLSASLCTGWEALQKSCNAAMQRVLSTHFMLSSLIFPAEGLMNYWSHSIVMSGRFLLCHLYYLLIDGSLLPGLLFVSKPLSISTWILQYACLSFTSHFGDLILHCYGRLCMQFWACIRSIKCLPCLFLNSISGRPPFCNLIKCKYPCQGWNRL